MSLFLRPVRLILFCGAAFVAGVFYERADQSDRCETLGGIWTTDDVCTQEAGHG